LLESEPEWKAGQLIYERLSNRAQLEHFKLDHADRTSTAKMTVVEYAEGPVWNSLRLRGDLPGCADARGVEVEIRLHHAGKRVEWLYQMHKLPVTDPEGLYVAFPFGLEAGRLMFEAQGALIEPGTGVILQVRELEGRASELTTDTLAPGRGATVTVVNALGHPLAAPSVVVKFKPYETRFLKLSF
jgi:hypothetical protein